LWSLGQPVQGVEMLEKAIKLGDRDALYPLAFILSSSNPKRAADLMEQYVVHFPKYKQDLESIITRWRGLAEAPPRPHRIQPNRQQVARAGNQQVNQSNTPQQANPQATSPNTQQQVKQANPVNQPAAPNKQANPTQVTSNQLANQQLTPPAKQQVTPTNPQQASPPSNQQKP
jgi:hypothetical protein